MIVLDSSFLVAFFNTDDVSHQKALSDMKVIEKQRQIISEYVVLETATVMLYKVGLKSAVKFLEVIREKNDLNIYYFDNTDFENIAEIFKKQQYQLSFVDASVIYLAKQTNSSIATYDEAMEKEFARCSKA